MTGMPLGWTRARVGDLATLIEYGTSAKATHAGDVPVLRMGNIVRGQINLYDLKYLPAAHSEFPELLLAPGDVLFNRTNSIEHVGKTAVYTGQCSPCSFASYLLRLRLRGYEPQLLSHFLNSAHGRNWVESVAQQQVGQANVNGTKLRELKIPVPPLAEQRRIVAKVTELLARNRRASAALEEIAVLEGNAVAWWTADGAWSDRTLDKYLVRRTELAGNNWSAFPVVGLSNEGEIVERRERVGAKSAHKCAVVRPGDVVFNPIRFSIGSIARYYGDAPALVSPEYVVFTTEGLSAELLVRFFRSSRGRSFLEAETTGSVRYRIYFKDLVKLTLPIAPPEEQARAEALFLALRKVSAQARAIGEQLADVESAILAKAFRGELVPQDPNDEPAEAMLARLKSEEGVVRATKPSRRRERGSLRER